jgi:formyltetrahydrofolate-dependent phosphoribosylglycinamide formyltransferase
MKMNIAVFGSGKGSNFRSILDKILEGEIPAKVGVVISNNSKSGILEIAREHNIPALHISQKQFISEEEFNNKILKVLEEFNINFIVLAGYMKKIDSLIVSKFKNRIINIHPALLPAFGGKEMYGSRVHTAVIDYGCKYSGATVHIVDDEYDHGAIILQESVPVLENDTPEILAARVLKIEHKIFPQAVKLFAENRIKIINRKVSIN